jgi:hypothetical protein
VKNLIAVLDYIDALQSWVKLQIGRFKRKKSEDWHKFGDKSTDRYSNHKGLYGTILGYRPVCAETVDSLSIKENISRWAGT